MVFQEGGKFHYKTEWANKAQSVAITGWPVSIHNERVIQNCAQNCFKDYPNEFRK